MKLEGSLDAFSLPDIFQLLSYTKKTGGLRLQHAGGQGVVYFADGAVTGASAEGGRQPLARRLIGMGLADDAAITAAVAAAKDGSGVGVVSALVAAGVVTADAASRVAFEQLHDAVFELLRWPSGDFQFAVDQVNPDDVGLRLVVDEVVKRASEHTARWAAASAIVPSPDAIPLLVGSAETAEVQASDWPVLRLVDGHRPVVEIVELAGAGQLATVVTLADLIERGLVEIRGADATDPVADVVRRMALLAPVETDAPAVVTTPTVAEPAVDAPEPVAPETVTAPVPEPEPEPEPTPSTVVTVAEPAAVAEPVAVVDDSAVASASAASDLSAESDESDESADEPGDHDTVVVPRPRLGGAHVPGDVVPPRAEPFLAARRPDFAESAPRVPGAAAATVGSAAVAAAPDGLIERDPSVNRSLLLRLIAGVRGL